MIFSDSLSALQALEKLNSNHPLLIQIHDMLHKIEVDQREVFFIFLYGFLDMWVFEEMRLQIERLKKLSNRNL